MNFDFLVDFPGLGIFDWGINRVAFAPFGVEVYWYGLLIAFASILSIFLSQREAAKFGLEPDFVLDNFLVIIPSMIVGARLYYIIFTWDLYKDDLMSIFDTRKGGLGFYGGVIGGLLGIIIFHLIKKRPLERFLDFIVVYIPLGQAIGRIGNFINQEAFGTNTDLPWGMISNGTTDYLAAHPELGQNPALPVHPTFLYEFIGNLILFFILHYFRKRNRIPYGTMAAYFMGYGIIRFFVEGIRTDSLYIGDSGIRASQLLSAIMVAVSLLYLLVVKRRKHIAKTAEAEALFEAAAQAREASAPAAGPDSDVKADMISDSGSATDVDPEADVDPDTNVDSDSDSNVDSDSAAPETSLSGEAVAQEITSVTEEPEGDKQTVSAPHNVSAGKSAVSASENIKDKTKERP